MSDRYRELDSLRGLASLTVVLGHCLITFNIFYIVLFHESISNWFLNIFAYSPLHIFWAGHEAVILFFILSGFVLSLPFFTNNSPNYKNFIIKRFFRIYIPYIVSIFISGMLFFLIKDNHSSKLSDWFNNMWSHPITPKIIISYLFMLGIDTDNLNTVTWTLVHEMRISIIFPLIMIFILNFNWIKSLSIGLIGSLFPWLCLSVLSENISQKDVSFLFKSFSDTFFYTSFFVVGAVLAKYRVNIIKIITQIKPITRILILLLSIFLYTIEWNVNSLASLKYYDGKEVLLIRLLIDASITFGVLIIFASAISLKNFKKILTNRFLLHLGKISYSLYLIHIIILLLFVYFTHNYISVWILILFVPTISILTASLMYKYIEAPSMALGKKLTQKKPPLKKPINITH